MNKECWISILLDGTVPAEEIQNLIDLSFKLTASKRAASKRAASKRAVSKRAKDRCNP